MPLLVLPLVVALLRHECNNAPMALLPVEPSSSSARAAVESARRLLELCRAGHALILLPDATKRKLDLACVPARASIIMGNWSSCREQMHAGAKIARLLNSHSPLRIARASTDDGRRSRSGATARVLVPPSCYAHGRAGRLANSREGRWCECDWDTAASRGWEEVDVDLKAAAGRMFEAESSTDRAPDGCFGDGTGGGDRGEGRSMRFPIDTRAVARGAGGVRVSGDGCHTRAFLPLRNLATPAPAPAPKAFADTVGSAALPVHFSIHVFALAGGVPLAAAKRSWIEGDAEPHGGAIARQGNGSAVDLCWLQQLTAAHATREICGALRELGHACAPPPTTRDDRCRTSGSGRDTNTQDSRNITSAEAELRLLGVPLLPAFPTQHQVNTTHRPSLRVLIMPHLALAALLRAAGTVSSPHAGEQHERGCDTWLHRWRRLVAAWHRAYSPRENILYASHDLELDLEREHEITRHLGCLGTDACRRSRHSECLAVAARELFGRYDRWLGLPGLKQFEFAHDTDATNTDTVRGRSELVMLGDDSQQAVTVAAAAHTATANVNGSSQSGVVTVAIIDGSTCCFELHGNEGGDRDNRGIHVANVTIALQETWRAMQGGGSVGILHRDLRVSSHVLRADMRMRGGTSSASLLTIIVPPSALRTHSLAAASARRIAVGISLMLRAAAPIIIVCSGKGENVFRATLNAMPFGHGAVVVDSVAARTWMASRRLVMDKWPQLVASAVASIMSMLMRLHLSHAHAARLRALRALRVHSSALALAEPVGAVLRRRGLCANDNGNSSNGLKVGTTRTHMVSSVPLALLRLGGQNMTVWSGISAWQQANQFCERSPRACNVTTGRGVRTAISHVADVLIAATPPGPMLAMLAQRSMRDDTPRDAGASRNTNVSLAVAARHRLPLLAPPLVSLNRTTLLLHLRARINARAYLEIGCDANRNFATLAACDPKVKSGCAGRRLTDTAAAMFSAHASAMFPEGAVCVDPFVGGTHRMTSDAFFASLRESVARTRRDIKGFFDLIFVDGLHRAEQVLRDAQHAIEALRPGGIVVLHDASPRTQQEARYPMPTGWPLAWNGDGWRAVLALRTRGDIDVAVGDFDHGCAVIRTRPNTDPLSTTMAEVEVTPAESNRMRSPSQMSWSKFDENRQRLLRLMSPSALLVWVA